MDYSKYKNTLEYPKHSPRPFLKNKPTVEEAEKFVKDLKEYEDQEKLYQVKLNLYNNEKGNLMDLFVDDLYIENGINLERSSAVDKANLVYAKAYEDRHGYGLEAVGQCFSELILFAEDLGVSFND